MRHLLVGWGSPHHRPVGCASAHHSSITPQDCRGGFGRPSATIVRSANLRSRVAPQHDSPRRGPTKLAEFKPSEKSPPDQKLRRDLRSARPNFAPAQPTSPQPLRPDICCSRILLAIKHPETRGLTSSPEIIPPQRSGPSGCGPVESPRRQGQRNPFRASPLPLSSPLPPVLLLGFNRPNIPATSNSSPRCANMNPAPSPRHIRVRERNSFTRAGVEKNSSPPGLSAFLPSNPTEKSNTQFVAALRRCLDCANSASHSSQGALVRPPEPVSKRIRARTFRPLLSR